jgi:hypothetical protein
MNVGIRVNWTHGSCTTCILNLQYAGYFETCNETKFTKTNNTELKLWWSHVTDIAFWSLVMGLYRFFIIASCLSELSWKSVKLCWVNENRTAGSQYIDGRPRFTLFHVYAKRQKAITKYQDRCTIKYILTRLHKNSLSLFESEEGDISSRDLLQWPPVLPTSQFCLFTPISRNHGARRE